MRKGAVLVLIVASAFAVGQDGSILVRFARGGHGTVVTLRVDGKVEKTFAGKLSFQEANRSWQSVCADVHSPVAQGQFFHVTPKNTESVGGNYAKAGRIVARYFAQAQSPEQCAGLQIAVWEAIEVGSDKPNFSSGTFQVTGDPITMGYAAQYYAGAAQTPNTDAAGGGGGGDNGLGTQPVTNGLGDSATLLQSSGGGQSQISP